MLKKIVILIGILFLVVSPVFAKGMPGTVQIKGSDTMVNLGQAWAETYMQKYPDAFIAVTGGGSGTGIASLINGTCDVVESSRRMKKKEYDLAAKRGIQPVEFEVAMDGLAVVVNPENPINELTVEELSDIFTGKVKNWKELGGEDLLIVILSREVNSGTHVYFKEHVVRRSDPLRKDEFTEESLLMPSSQAVADEIALNPNAIGYYGMGYVNETQKVIAIAKDRGSPYYKPTIENIMEGNYYISRPLLMYTDGQPQGLIKDFMDFILSEEGQKIVEKIDFVPIKL